MQEIERVFLLKKLPKDLKSCKNVYLKSSELSNGDQVLRLRMERKDKKTKYEITKKYYKISDSKSRQEVTIDLSKEEFDKLWNSVDHYHERTRYFYPIGKYVAEIDFYKGNKNGYCRIGVEFPSISEAEAFTPPPWFGKEVEIEVDSEIHRDFSKLNFDELTERYKKFGIKLEKIADDRNV